MGTTVTMKFVHAEIVQVIYETEIFKLSHFYMS